ncbi:MAG: hypothetical protein AAGA54_28510 [Myxococcota bacterium]
MRMRGGRMSLRQTALLAVAALCGACSSLAPKPPEVECTGVDDVAECGEGFACESGICRDASNRPPIAHIGFDVQEVASGQAQFRVEFAGCDQEVESTGNAIKVLSLPRAQVARRLFLGVFDPDDTQGTPQPLDATFTLSQPSRFNREGLRRQVTYALGEEAELDTLEVTWPRYFADNSLPSFLGADGYLLWQTQPAPVDDAPAAALRYQLVAPPVVLEDVQARSCSDDRDCCEDEGCDAEDVINACIPSQGQCRSAFDDLVTYTYNYERACDRQIRGTVVAVQDDLETARALPGSSVTVRHADAPADTPLSLARLEEPVADPPSQCDDDEDCVEGLVCNRDTEQCELPLAGLTAWSGTVPAEPDPGAEGLFDARTFTYCAGQPTGEPLTRSFDVTVTPPEDEDLPTVVLRADVVFDPVQAGQTPPANFPKNLCVPEVGPSQALTLRLDGPARTLIDAYTCCDVDCLPRTEDDASGEPPEPRTACGGAGSGTAPTYRVETPLQLAPELIAAWNAEDSPCLQFGFLDDGSVGFLRRSATCETLDASGTAQPQCDLSLPAPADATARTYAVRIETPTGSVLGSLDTSIEVSLADGPLDVGLDLPPRTIVQGRVRLGDDVCDPLSEQDADCGSPGAQVLAERLRMSTETTDNTPGPYFHQVATYLDPTASVGGRDGAYALPLDPGVWVITALPDAGTPGGPAAFQILDLREGPETFDVDLTLQEGTLVTLDVQSFDRRAQVIPLDIGSWFDSELVHPDRVDETGQARLVDLGARGECLAREGDSLAATGCRIRRLIGGTALPPTQVGQVRFTARDLDTEAGVICL